MWHLIFLLLICLSSALNGSEIPNFQHLEQTQGSIFFLTTKRSGSNLISASLSIITRKPISWLEWKRRVFNPDSVCRKHPSYNRLGLLLVTDEPLLYRTHYGFRNLRKIPSHLNQLIFVTRNPKELIYREFFLTASLTPDPNPEFIKNFLDEYLQTFQIYEEWAEQNRFIVFYEDFLIQGDKILLKLLAFMKEPALYLEDYLAHKQEYLSRLLASYAAQHVSNRGGASSAVGGSKPIHYTKNANPEILLYIDEYLRKKAPRIWERYLHRFASGNFP